MSEMGLSVSDVCGTLYRRTERSTAGVGHWRPVNRRSHAGQIHLWQPREL